MRASGWGKRAFSHPAPADGGSRAGCGTAGSAMVSHTPDGFDAQLPERWCWSDTSGPPSVRPARTASNGLPASNGKGPLWMRLDGVSANGSGSLSLPAVRPVGFPAMGERGWFGESSRD